MNIAPIDIASIVASLTTIGVALSARPKSEGKEADGSNYENISSLRPVVTCFFIYALCGLFTAILSYMSSVLGKSTWGSVNVVWVVGNAMIAFILYSNYLSKKASRI